MKKKMFAVLMAALLVSVSAMAHCGKCGVGDKTESAVAEAKCAHSEKSATLTQAASELKASNPDLSAKLEAIVKDCCSKDAKEHVHA